ncbi:MAG: conjugal transfer protein [Clostridia bacterium]|nr:conjugal transfer protein [Clostridia bacterium]
MQRASYWIYCPGCKRRTRIKVYDNTVLIHFPLYCHWCKREQIISYVKENLMLEKEEKAEQKPSPT